MAFRLAVADIVEFDVKFSLKNKGKLLPFKVTKVTADRIPQDTLLDELKNSEQTTAEFLQEHIKGFESQNLVLDDESSEPAGYSAESLAALLNVTGVGAVVLAEYMKACGAEGKRGN